MKWAYGVANKAKAAAGLCAILVIILLGHISYRNDFARMEHSLSSIYKDRLMPATYIYNISNHLYEKRLLAEHKNQYSIREYTTMQQMHDAAIASIIHSYEKTFLTLPEQQEWQAFKQNLARYNTHTTPYTQLVPISIQSTPDKDFNNTIASLNALSSIQAGEGNNIRRSSKSIVNATMLTSYMEAALLIVLGLFTIVVISTSDKAIFKQQQQQIWN
ncbi:MAG: MCP four helix bundle domain-containing protein [Flavipsychrobacter sp.]|nr:MCP four helix bundle domain-containing protein [Flavipsychrobacter sp.]